MSNLTAATTRVCFSPQPVYCLMSLSLVATPLHFLIIRVLIVRFRCELTRHKILLCLSVSDNLQILGLGLITVIGLGLQPTVTSHSCQVLRQIVEVLLMQTHSASTAFILLLAVERYISCVFSLRVYTIITPSRANFAVISAWVISIFGGLLSLHPNEPNYSRMAMSNNSRILWLYSTTVMVSSVSLSVIQARLYRLSRTKLKVVPHNMFGRQKEKEDLTRRQLKLSFAASVVIILYVVCMFPLACLAIYSLLNPIRDVTNIKQALAFLAMLNTFVDPFVYGFGMPDVRKGIKKECKDFKKRIYRECNVSGE